MLSLEEARRRFAPHEPRLAQCISKAVEEYFTEYPTKFLLYHSRRTRANVIYSHMEHHARELFDEMPGVRVSVRRGLFTLIFGDWGVLKLKFLDKHLRTRNIDTQQSLDFLHQQGVLPYMPDEATNFHAGYQLDDLGAGIAGIFITAPRGHGAPAYYWPLNSPGSEIVVPLPVSDRPIMPITGRRGPRVKKPNEGVQNE